MRARNADAVAGAVTGKNSFVFFDFQDVCTAVHVRRRNVINQVPIREREGLHVHCAHFDSL